MVMVFVCIGCALSGGITMWLLMRAMNRLYTHSVDRLTHL